MLKNYEKMQTGKEVEEKKKPQQSSKCGIQECRTSWTGKQ